MAGNKTIKTVLIGKEIYREDFEAFTYQTSGTKVNSCENSILDVTSTDENPFIIMEQMVSFQPKEYRYIEIKYKTTDNKLLEIYTIKEPKDDTYCMTSNELITDGNWHTVVLDLWSNENIKNQQEITGWRLDWGDNQIGVSMQIDYIKVI